MCWLLRSIVLSQEKQIPAVHVSLSLRFQNFSGGLYTEDLGLVTQLPVPKQILLSEGQRDQLARKQCGRQFY